MKVLTSSDSNCQSLVVCKNEQRNSHFNLQRIPHLVQTTLAHLVDVLSKHFIQSKNLSWQFYSLASYASSQRSFRFSKWMIVAVLISSVNANMAISGKSLYIVTPGTNTPLKNPPFSIAGASSSTVTFSCSISALNSNFHGAFFAPSLTNTSATDWDLHGTQDVINTGFQSLVVNCPSENISAPFQINCAEGGINFGYSATMNFTLSGTYLPPSSTTTSITTTTQTSLPSTLTSSLTQTMLSVTTPISSIAQTTLASSSIVTATSTLALTQTPSVITQIVSTALSMAASLSTGSGVGLSSHSSLLASSPSSVLGSSSPTQIQLDPAFQPSSNGTNPLDWALIAVAAVALACSILAFGCFMKRRANAKHASLEEGKKPSLLNVANPNLNPAPAIQDQALNRYSQPPAPAANLYIQADAPMEGSEHKYIQPNAPWDASVKKQDYSLAPGAPKYIDSPAHGQALNGYNQPPPARASVSQSNQQGDYSPLRQSQRDQYDVVQALPPIKYDDVSAVDPNKKDF